MLWRKQQTRAACVNQPCGVCRWPQFWFCMLKTLMHVCACKWVQYVLHLRVSVRDDNAYCNVVQSKLTYKLYENTSMLEMGLMPLFCLYLLCILMNISDIIQHVILSLQRQTSISKWSTGLLVLYLNQAL